MPGRPAARIRGGRHPCGPTPRSSAGRDAREAEQEPLWDARGAGALGGTLHDYPRGVAVLMPA
eukprot:14626572-Alexandrium_andersonii.AAC.1